MITFFIIGPEITLPIYIYTQIKFGITPAINAVATLLIVSSLDDHGPGLADSALGPASVRRVRSRRAQRMQSAAPAAPGSA